MTVIEFQDKFKRRVIIDTNRIVCLIEKIEYAVSGDSRFSGMWEVVLDTNYCIEVDRETKEFIVDKWEGVVTE